MEQTECNKLQVSVVFSQTITKKQGGSSKKLPPYLTQIQSIITIFFKFLAFIISSRELMQVYFLTPYPRINSINYFYFYSLALTL